MKYVISDIGEVEIVGEYHYNMAEGFKGKVIAAGHYDFTDGKIRVFGRSIHYGIPSNIADAALIEAKLHESTIS